MGRRRRLHSVLLPVGLAGLLLGAAACGSSSGGSGGSAAAPDTSLDSKTTQELATQAEQEGSITWYTTFADDDVQPIVAAFNKTYPKVKVNSLRLSADKIPQRILTEQKGGKHNADVVSGDSPQLAQLLQAGSLQPYTPKDIAPLPSGLSLPEGYEGVVYAVTTTVAYNPKLLQQKGLPVPKSWEDLTQPGLEGPVLHRPRRGQLVRQPGPVDGPRQGAGPAQAAGRQQPGVRGEPHPGADPGAGR